MPPTQNPSAPGPTHYDLLEVASTANVSELRQAFRQLSKRYHPDTTSLPQAQAQESFRQLQQAYAVLSDPISRNRYDSQLLQPPGPISPSGAPAQPPPRPSTPRPVGVRRALSGGEWFALLLLGLALVLSLVLGLGVAWARGAALVRTPSWWPEAVAAAAAPDSPPDSALTDAHPAP
jgi:predicted lipid-binding transport protein (Tim44 family)